MEYQLRAPRIPEYTAVEQVLTNRGIQYQDIQHYINTSRADIYDPLLLKNMQRGAQMLIHHIAEGHGIYLTVDADCDGYTSAALFINYLYRLFPISVENNITYVHHPRKAHGIIVDQIPNGTKLVVALDASSSEYKIHKELAAAGIDVLVLDHHKSALESEYACIINNQLCDYPNKSLCGVGVVYKFCSYIDSLMGTNYADDYLDLVALGETADVMDLRQFETRELVSAGLKQIRNPYLIEAIEHDSFHFSGNITSIDIAFYIAPLVNAITRVGTQEEKSTLFESMLEFKAKDLIPSTKRGCKGQFETRVEQACRNCTNVKNRQTKLRDIGLEKIEQLIETKDLLNNKILLVLLDDPEINKNLTGLMANVLMDKYQRPAILMHKIFDDSINNYIWAGSARAPSNTDLQNFRTFCEKTGKVLYAEGHESAFGIAIPYDGVEAFTALTNEVLQDFDFTPKYLVDFIYNAHDISAKDILEVAEMKSFWGHGVEEASIALENIKITSTNLQLMSKDKNPTLKITMPDGISLIKFKSSQEEYEKLYSSQGYVSVNIVGKCERNIWNNNISPQIIITEYEIVDRATYYF